MNGSSPFDATSLACWAAGDWVPERPERVNGFAHDTRAVRPGDCFVAIKGARFDGHDFVSDAFKRGAGSALVRRDRVAGLAHAGPLLAVADPLSALQSIAAAHRGQAGARIVGVTGSSGKTTVKEFIADMLATTWRTTRTRGNWNNEIGLPLSLLTLEPGTQAGVFELGISHPGEMAPLCRMARPDWGVISNIGPVHIEFFDSLESIAREKGEMLRQLPADGAAVLSLDEPCYPVLRELVPCRVVTVSLSGDADYRMDEGAEAGTVIVHERRTGDRCTLRLPVPGRHNRHNVLLAVAVARGFEVAWPAVAEALRHFRPPPMRWETRQAHGITVINDAYNANPLSMRAALTTFHESDAAGGKWLVLGGMLELGSREADEHAAVGRQLAEGRWAGLVSVGRLGGQIADGAVSAGWPEARVVRCDSAPAAGDALAERVRSGDEVLFKASRGFHLEEAVARLLERLTARETAH